MSRVEQALRRAGNARVVAPGDDQFPGPEVEGSGRPVLELYPVEQAGSVEPATAARASRAPQGVTPQSQNRVLPRRSPEFDAKLVTNSGVSTSSIEQYR